MHSLKCLHQLSELFEVLGDRAEKDSALVPLSRAIFLNGLPDCLLEAEEPLRSALLQVLQAGDR